MSCENQKIKITLVPLLPSEIDDDRAKPKEDQQHPIFHEFRELISTKLERDPLYGKGTLSFNYNRNLKKFEYNYSDNDVSGRDINTFLSEFLDEYFI